MSNQNIYCPSCGTELRTGAKFCPSCGKKIYAAPNQMSNGGGLEMHVEEKKTRNPILNVLLILAIGIVGYVGYGLLQSEETSSFDAETTLAICEGTYTDMTGMLTGIKNGEIDVVSRNDHLIGKGRSGNFSFDLVAVAKHEFTGKANLNGVVTEHRVLYDLDQKRLTFTRDGSPLDWYIEKE